jgi:hypothetical protein
MASGGRFYETAIGCRPNRFQLLKVGYERHNGPATSGSLGSVFSPAIGDEAVGHRHRAQLKKLKRLKQSPFHLFYTKYLN